MRAPVFVLSSLCGIRSGGFSKSILALAALMALPGAPSFASTVARCEGHALRAHQTLAADRLDNWEPLDDQTVLIWVRRSVRARLIRLEAPLADLAEADVIHLIDGDRDNLISPCGRDGIAIGNSAGDWQVARIISVELLSKKRTAELDYGARAQVAATDSLRI